MSWDTTVIRVNIWTCWETSLKGSAMQICTYDWVNAKLVSPRWIFLGHTLQKDAIAPQNETVGEVLNTGRPKTKKESRSLLRMVNFHCRYIPNCAEITAQITELTKNRAPEFVKWGDSNEKAFTEIKRLLSNEPMLKLPDLEREFILQTDASNLSLGACLLQEHDGVKHPVLYASKKLLPQEQNYSVGEWEALAIICSTVIYMVNISLWRVTIVLSSTSNQAIQGLWDGVWLYRCSEVIPIHHSKILSKFALQTLSKLIINLKQKHRPMKDNAYRQDLVSVYREGC